MTAANNNRNLLSLADAAEYIGVHPRTLSRYRREGRIQGYRVGPRLVKFDQADLDALVCPIPPAGS